MEKVLKPCPFCGGPVEMFDKNRGPGMHPTMSVMVIGCKRCEMHVEFYQRSQVKILKQWNTRTTPQE